MSTNKFGDGISWETHVHEIIDSHDISEMFYTKENEKIEHLKKYKSHGKVLDCGCHVGRWIEVFRGNNYDYVGIDQSSLAIETFKRYKPDAKIVHSLLWNMSFDNEFDIAHFNAVLQHNRLEEQEKILPKVYQALKPNGILIIAESTVLKPTQTQRTYQGWITFIEKHGFKFMESWHNNELNLEDNYLFVKSKNPTIVGLSKNATKEDLSQLLKHKVHEKYEKQTTDKPEIIIPDYPKINITMQTNNASINNNTIHMSEYWNLEDNVIPLIKCIKLWRYLKVGEKCYFEYNVDIPEEKEHYIKSIFKEVGFKYIETIVNMTNIPRQYILIFEKLSIIKIRNWYYLRHIHKLLNNTR